MNHFADGLRRFIQHRMLIPDDCTRSQTRRRVVVITGHAASDEIVSRARPPEEAAAVVKPSRLRVLLSFNVNSTAFTKRGPDETAVCDRCARGGAPGGRLE